MSNSRGSAYGISGEFDGAALGNTIIDGFAVGDNVAFETQSQVFEIISMPSTAEKYEDIYVEIRCNKKTNYIVTYTVSGGTETGLGRTVDEITDEGDYRIIRLHFSLGSNGTRTIRFYGSTQSSSAANYRSLTYLDRNITIGASLLMGMPPDVLDGEPDLNNNGDGENPGDDVPINEDIDNRPVYLDDDVTPISLDDLIN